MSNPVPICTVPDPNIFKTHFMPTTADEKLLGLSIELRPGLGLFT